MFEQVKDYKSACAVLGKKPIDKRRKLDEHVILYIMLSTITEAINFSKHGTVGGTLIGIRLKMVPLRVYSFWVLTMTLVLRVLVSVLI